MKPVAPVTRIMSSVRSGGQQYGDYTGENRFLQESGFRDDRGLIELLDRPTAFMGQLLQAGIRIDGDGMAHEVQQGLIAVTVGVEMSVGQGRLVFARVTFRPGDFALDKVFPEAISLP